MDDSTKVCTKCDVEKSLDNFHRSRDKKDGRCSNCKACRNAHNKKYDDDHKEERARYQARHKEKQRNYAKQWHLDNREELNTRTRQRHADNREKVKTYNQHYYQTHLEEAAANAQVRQAIQDGRLTPQPCEECDATKDVHGHHDDYNKPLEVRWLCRSCHQLWHHDNH